MRKTDNGLGPSTGPGYRLPEDGPLPDLPLYEHLIDDGVAEADRRALSSITSPLGAWPSGWPLGLKRQNSRTAWSASSRPERSTRTSRPSCASTPARAPTPTSRKPPDS